MTLQRNHYEVLGVPPTATTDQIKKKYRELARKFHPDVVKDKALGQKIFTQINQAYRILADPERRAQYDASLRADRDAGPAQRPPGPTRRRPPRAACARPAPAPTGPAPQRRSAPPGRPAPTAAADSGRHKLLGDADFALMNGDAQAARAHCEAALKIDPRNARALGLLGDALVVLDQREAAAAAYRRSLQITPSRAGAGQPGPPGERRDPDPHQPAGGPAHAPAPTRPPGRAPTRRAAGRTTSPPAASSAALLGKKK